MLELNNFNKFPIKKNNLCFIMQNNNNDMINNVKYNNIHLFQNFFIEGVQNFVIIASLLLINRTLYGNNTNKIIIKLTDPLINLSKNIINFDNFSYQIALSAGILTYITTISGVAANDIKN